jgi:hypothetical protein
VIEIAHPAPIVATTVAVALYALCVLLVARRQRLLAWARRWSAHRSREKSEYEHRDRARSMLRTLVEALNESDPDERRRLIERCCRPGAVLLDPGGVVSGRAELVDRFGLAHADPMHVVEIVAPVRARGQQVWTRWEITGTDSGPVSQTVTARVDPVTAELSEVRVKPAGEPAQASWWRRAADVVVANPLAAVGVVGSATYLALRLPTQLFYARLGTTPDEVGLGPQVLVPQSLGLLALILLGGALVYPIARSRTALSLKVVPRLWQDQRRLRAFCAGAIVVVVFLAVLWLGIEAVDALLRLDSDLRVDEPLPDWMLVMLLALVVWLAAFVAPRAGMVVRGGAEARRELTAERRRRRDRWERRYTFLSGTLAVTFATLLLLTVIALNSGGAVRDGGDAGGELFPWRAVPATVAWKETAARAELTNRCGELRMLGGANSQVVVFDTRRDQAFRIPLADATVSTMVDCLWIRVTTAVGLRHCSAGRCEWDVDLTIVTSDRHAEPTGVISVRDCERGRCTYRRIGEIETRDLRLARGVYRLTLTATEGERRAEQITDLRVP